MAKYFFPYAVCQTWHGRKKSFETLQYRRLFYDVPLRASATHHITGHFRAVAPLVWWPRSVLLKTTNTTLTR